MRTCRSTPRSPVTISATGPSAPTYAQILAYLTASYQTIYGSDADLLAKAAHKLKGACLGLYATTAAELTAVIERSGKDGTLGALPGRLDDLETALEETIAQMRAYIARRAAPR